MPARPIAILGESGSGKTTLARAISCLLPQSAKVSGQIEICGYPVSKMKEADLKKIRMEQFSGLLSEFFGMAESWHENI